MVRASFHASPSRRLDCVPFRDALTWLNSLALLAYIVYDTHIATQSQQRGRSQCGLREGQSASRRSGAGRRGAREDRRPGRASGAARPCKPPGRKCAQAPGPARSGVDAIRDSRDCTCAEARACGEGSIRAEKPRLRGAIDEEADLGNGYAARARAKFDQIAVDNKAALKLAGTELDIRISAAARFGIADNQTRGVRRNRRPRPQNRNRDRSRRAEAGSCHRPVSCFNGARVAVGTLHTRKSRSCGAGRSVARA
jgi:hypothetical protein